MLACDILAAIEPRRPWSAPFAGVVAGVVTGVADCLFLQYCIRCRGTPLLPSGTYPSVLWLWVTLLSGVGLLLSGARFRPLALPAMLVAGPGVLLLSRLSEPVKAWSGLSTRATLMAWLLLLLLAAVPAWRLRLAAPRTRWRWAVPVAISASLIVVAALDVRMGDWLFPRRSPAGGGHRNVVLVVLDTVRYDDALGSAPAMPNLERFARNGLAFDQAWATVPWTVPSHFAMLSGTDPWRLPFNRMERRFTKTMTLAPQRFRSAGYATASVSGNPLLSSEVGFGAGFDELSVSRGAGVCRSAIGDLLSRLWVHDLPRSPVCGWYIASEVTDRALRFVRRARRPYFLMLNYMDAHDPYYVPPECEEEWRVRFPRAAREAWVNATHRDAELRRRTHDRYRAAMRCLDRSLGRLLDALEADSDAATTTIVIAGDHGEQFAERGLIGHGNSVYPEALRVPLVIRGPDVPGGRIGDPVSLTDLHTVLLQILHPRRLGGPLRLLDPHRRRQPVVAYFAAIHPRPSAAFSVISSEVQYIRWNDGRETLLDTESGAPLPLEAVPDLVSPARALAIRETRTATKANAFDGLGYLQ